MLYYYHSSIKLSSDCQLDETRGSFWVTFTFCTFLPEHSFMLKSWGWGGGVVAHVIIVSAQVLLILTLGLWTLGLRTRAWQFSLDMKNFGCERRSPTNLKISFSKSIPYFHNLQLKPCPSSQLPLSLLCFSSLSEPGLETCNNVCWLNMWSTNKTTP